MMEEVRKPAGDCGGKAMTGNNRQPAALGRRWYRGPRIWGIAPMPVCWAQAEIKREKYCGLYCSSHLLLSCHGLNKVRSQLRGEMQPRVEASGTGKNQNGRRRAALAPTTHC